MPRWPPATPQPWTHPPSPPLPLPPQYLDSKLEAHLKLDWYNEQAVKSEARRQANQPVIIHYSSISAYARPKVFTRIYEYRLQQYNSTNAVVKCLVEPCSLWARAVDALIANDGFLSMCIYGVRR